MFNRFSFLFILAEPLVIGVVALHILTYNLVFFRTVQAKISFGHYMPVLLKSLRVMPVYNREEIAQRWLNQVVYLNFDWLGFTSCQFIYCFITRKVVIKKPTELDGRYNCSNLWSGDIVQEHLVLCYANHRKSSWNILRNSKMMRELSDWVHPCSVAEKASITGPIPGV